MQNLLNALKRNLAAGILVLFPAGVSAWLVVVLWTAVDRPLRDVLARYEAPPVPGFGLFLVLAFIYMVGLLARTLFGRALIQLGEKIVARLPIVNTLYSGLKQVMEAIFSGSSGAFRQAVLIEYPRKGLWSVAFLTSVAPKMIEEAAGELDSEMDKGENVFCFVPTTPNPTSGYLLMVPRKDIVPLNLTVDEAVKLVISGGILTPVGIPKRSPTAELAETGPNYRTLPERDSPKTGN